MFHSHAVLTWKVLQWGLKIYLFLCTQYNLINQKMLFYAFTFTYLFLILYRPIWLFIPQPLQLYWFLLLSLISYISALPLSHKISSLYIFTFFQTFNSLLSKIFGGLFSYLSSVQQFQFDLKLFFYPEIFTVYVFWEFRGIQWTVSILLFYSRCVCHCTCIMSCRPIY